MIPDRVTHKTLELSAKYARKELHLPLEIDQPVPGYYELWVVTKPNHGFVRRLGGRMTGREMYAYIGGLLDGARPAFKQDLLDVVARAEKGDSISRAMRPDLYG